MIDDLLDLFTAKFVEGRVLKDQCLENDGLHTRGVTRILPPIVQEVGVGITHGSNRVSAPINAMAIGTVFAIELFPRGALREELAAASQRQHQYRKCQPTAPLAQIVSCPHRA